MTPILEFQANYKWLSNFARVPITLDGITYQSVEHAFMSAKCDDPDWKRFCQTTHSPGIVKKASRNVKLIENWDIVKINIMRQLIDQKFDKEPFRSLLITTNSRHIQEGNRWGDRFWGVDINSGIGENWLGNIIMEKRSRLLSTKGD